MKHLRGLLSRTLVPFATPLLRACVNCSLRSLSRASTRRSLRRYRYVFSRALIAPARSNIREVTQTRVAIRVPCRYNPLVNILSRGAAVPRGRTLSNDRLSSSTSVLVNRFYLQPFASLRNILGPSVAKSNEEKLMGQLGAHKLYSFAVVHRRKRFR